MNSEFCMYALLIPLTTCMLWAIVNRLLFHGSYELADQSALEKCLAAIRASGRPDVRSDLGWVSAACQASGGDVNHLRGHVEAFQRRVERWHDAQKLLAELAMGVGFLFTVVSLVAESGSRMDPALIIGLGMQSTKYGLCIALPGSFFHGMFHKRVERFLDQTNELLEAIRFRGAIVPNVSSPVPRLSEKRA